MQTTCATVICAKNLVFCKLINSLIKSVSELKQSNIDEKRSMIDGNRKHLQLHWCVLGGGGVCPAQNHKDRVRDFERETQMQTHCMFI